MSVGSEIAEPFVQSIFKRFIAKTPKRMGDKRVFRQPRSLVWFMVFMGLLLMAMPFVQPEEKVETEALVAYWIFVAALFITAFLYSRYKMEVYDDGRILSTNLWGQKKEFYFLNVENVKADSKGSIIFKLDDGGKAKFDRYMTGEPVMYQLIEQNVPDIKYAALKAAKPKNFSQA